MIKKTINVNAMSKLILSISAFVLCVSLFVFSINKAVANDTNGFNFPEKLTNKDYASINNSNGRYRIEFNTQYIESKKATFIYVYAYDTTTGKSQLYYGDTKSGSIQKANSRFSLPSSPVK